MKTSICIPFGPLVLATLTQAAKPHWQFPRDSPSTSTTPPTSSASFLDPHSTVEPGLTLPREPENGTFIIKSNNVVNVSKGSTTVQMLLDLNSPCTWLTTVDLQCFNETTDGSTSSTCSWQPAYSNESLIADNNTALPRSSCEYFDRTTFVQGQLRSGDLDVGGFFLTNQSVLAASNFTFMSSSEESIMFDANSSISGVLGLGLPAPLLNSDGIQLNDTAFLGPWSGILKLPPGRSPVPVISLALPSDHEAGRLVLGGMIKNLSVPTVGDPIKAMLFNGTDYDIGYNPTIVTVDLVQTPQTRNTTISNSLSRIPGLGWYMIDTMAAYIYTDAKAAEAVANMFQPPANLSGDGMYVVDCSAILRHKVAPSVVIEGRAFAIRPEEMIVPNDFSQCTSAFQVSTTNTTNRLGWPFLKSVVLFFDYRDWTVNVTAKAPQNLVSPGPKPTTSTSPAFGSKTTTAAQSKATIASTSNVKTSVAATRGSSSTLQQTKDKSPEAPTSLSKTPKESSSTAITSSSLCVPRMPTSQTLPPSLQTSNAPAAHITGPLQFCSE